MAALRKNAVVLLLALLAQYWPQPAQGQVVTRTCPPGYLVQQNRGGLGFYCTPDPCTIGNPCGPGNTCTALGTPSFTTVTNCSCNPPYKSGIVPSFTNLTICYLPGQDACNPNPCQNGGTCSYINGNVGGFPGLGPPLTDEQGTKYAFTCECGSTGFTGRTCSDTFPGPAPTVTATVNGVTGPLANAVLEFICNSNSLPPIPCIYADGKHFTCCNGSACGPIGPDGNTPICPSSGFTPTPNNYPVQSSRTPPAPTGDQGICGTGAATAFPTRCYFNSDPQGRYVCCDNQGCNGFNDDNLTPHCKNYGYVPPNNGLSGASPPSTPPSTPPTGDQGVCGSGAATAFPTRCYFNSDPQGRYVCCDNQGCNGFNDDNLTPHCKNYGYVPPNNGLAGPTPPSTPPSTPPITPPSGDQGVCGTGDATSFPVRCWFNNDPRGRYVCCDNDGCNGFASPDFLFPRCKTNGYAPSGFGV